MEPPFDPTALSPLIAKLPYTKRIAFALSCAERLFPNYVAFVHHHHWGNIHALEQALEIVWRVISGENIEGREIKACALECERAAPHTEDFDSVYVSAALDAANSCWCLMEILQHGDMDRIAEVAALARDTVDMQIQEVESIRPLDDARENMIYMHPRMQRELAQQRKDLETIAAIELDESGLEELARRWRHTPWHNG